jgi:hypothetical protein
MILEVNAAHKRRGQDFTVVVYYIIDMKRSIISLLSRGNFIHLYDIAVGDMIRQNVIQNIQIRFLWFRGVRRQV